MADLTMPAEPASQWTPWSPTERESFFDAIARYRRAVWRVTVASTLANVLTALIVAALMSPLFYAAFVILLDIVNIAIPMPNLAGQIFETLSPMLDAPEKVSAGEWFRLFLLAAWPGLIWMGVVIFALRRMLMVSATFDGGALSAREPDETVLAEQRFANVVAEMAIAANLPAPRVRIVEHGGLNAAVFGRDENHATVVISSALLERLNRDELQGVAAHLVGSIANGDMEIGLRAAVTMSLFGLIARLGTVLVNGKGAVRSLARILRDTLMPTAARARKLAEELADPFAEPKAEAAVKVSATAPTTGGAMDAAGSGRPNAAFATQSTGGAPQAPGAENRAQQLGEPHTSRTFALLRKTPLGRVDWEKVRPFLWMPLAGPLVMTGFFGGIVSSFVLGPLLSLAWRQRKYMADATAVRLTRDPDTLSSALDKMNRAGGGSAFAPWAAHLSVVRLNSGQSSLLGGGAVPMFPALDRRLRALQKLGARIEAIHTTQMPLRTQLIVAPLLAIVAVLIAIVLPLIVWLSLALTMLFTGLPVGILHLLLRWIGRA